MRLRLGLGLSQGQRERDEVLLRGTPAQQPVAEALAQLQEALAGLRDLARGIHPAMLSERGLTAALEVLVARSPVPVELRAPHERVAPAAEAAISNMPMPPARASGRNAHGCEPQGGGTTIRARVPVRSPASIGR